MNEKPIEMMTYSLPSEPEPAPPSEPEPAPVAGPSRRAPMFYAGERYAGRRMQYPDVQRYPDSYVPALRGKPVSARNKFMRRLIRKAFKTHHSSVDKALKLPRAMLEQARLIAKEEGKSSRFARRFFERELALHDTVYVPSSQELRSIRTQKRKDKRAGKKDAIAQLVEKMSKP